MSLSEARRPALPPQLQPATPALSLLGGQINGGLSVGEMVNVLAVMIQNGMTGMEIGTLLIGTHPLLTSSPVVDSTAGVTVNVIAKRYAEEGRRPRERKIEPEIAFFG